MTYAVCLESEIQKVSCAPLGDICIYDGMVKWARQNFSLITKRWYRYQCDVRLRSIRLRGWRGEGRVPLNFLTNCGTTVFCGKWQPFFYMRFLCCVEVAYFKHGQVSRPVCSPSFIHWAVHSLSYISFRAPCSQSYNLNSGAGVFRRMV